MTIKYRIICWLFHKLSKEEAKEFKKRIKFLENLDILSGTINKFMIKHPPLSYVYEDCLAMVSLFPCKRKKSNFIKRSKSIIDLIWRMIGRIVFCSIIGHWWGHWCLGKRCCYVCRKIQTIDEFCGLEKEELEQ